MRKIKDFIKSNVKVITAFIIGILVTSGVVYAATLIDARDVTYSPNGEWSVNNVSSALDELYNITGGIPNDVRNYLKIGNINKDYTSITQVLEDTETLQTLINNDRACNYLKDSNDWVSLFTSNETAMTYIGANDYCANTLLADSTWSNAIANSTYFEKVLNVSVPIMTSNTTPSGEASCYKYNSNGGQAYLIFDGNDSTYVDQFYGYEGNIKSQWAQYKFVNSTIIKKVRLLYLVQSGAYLKSFKIQASNDGSNWTDIQTFNISDNSTDVTVTVNNSIDYTYWRWQGISSSNGYSIEIKTLQFYGR